METVVQFGAPMRLLGFSFEESIALLGKWEKEGVNTETAMAGLKFSVKTLAKEGVKAADMGEAFRRKLDAIKKSADPVGESIKLFGLRAGPDLAAAIIEGRFATEDLLAIIGDTDETIATATAATEDFGDALAKAFNAAKVQFGDAFSFLGSIGQTLGPLLYILPGITAAFGKLAGSIVGKHAVVDQRLDDRSRDTGGAGETFGVEGHVRGGEVRLWWWASGRRGGRFLSSLPGVEFCPDHLEGEEVVALLTEDVPDTFDIDLAELPIPRGSPRGMDEPFTLEEAQFRHRHRGELLEECFGDVADAERR